MPVNESALRQDLTHIDHLPRSSASRGLQFALRFVYLARLLPATSGTPGERVRQRTRITSCEFLSGSGRYGLARCRSSSRRFMCRRSDFDRDGFSPRSGRGVLDREVLVGFDNELKGFPQISPSFAQSSSLRIYARNLLHIGNVPAPALLEYSGEFPLHVQLLPAF